jgi:hypothetical protein
MDVPDTNKWTANSRQRYASPTHRSCMQRAIAELRSLFLVVMHRLMMEASLKIHNMACVIQENFNSYIDALVPTPSSVTGCDQCTNHTHDRAEDRNAQGEEANYYPYGRPKRRSPAPNQ